MELTGTPTRPIYPLWFGKYEFRYFAQLSENGISVQIYDNFHENEFIGSISIREIKSMLRNFKSGKESPECPHGHTDWDECPDCGH